MEETNSFITLGIILPQIPEVSQGLRAPKSKKCLVTCSLVPQFCLSLTENTPALEQRQKLVIANYNHDLKKLIQQVCDELKEQGVLKIPQDHNITI